MKRISLRDNGENSDIRCGGISKGPVNAKSYCWGGGRGRKEAKGIEREREIGRGEEREGGRTIVEICMNRSRLFGRGMSTPPQEK